MNLKVVSRFDMTDLTDRKFFALKLFTAVEAEKHLAILVNRQFRSSAVEVKFSVNNECNYFNCNSLQ